MAAIDWGLQPEDIVKRRELHDRLDGARYGGIGPSRQTPNVFVFTDPR